MEVREKVEVIQIQKETMESNVTDKYDNGKLRWNTHANKNTKCPLLNVTQQLLIAIHHQMYEKTIIT